MTSHTLADIYMPSWQHTRQMTYDYLDMLEPPHLELRLPFPESQTLGNQFWCMTGAHESYLSKLECGSWQGFACSLSDFDISNIKGQMQKADAKMTKLLARLDFDSVLDDDSPAHWTVLQIIKHENHHHGQLINFMYCHQLSIPASWADEWALGVS